MGQCFTAIPKPDASAAMGRIEAWYNHDVLDRAPVQFAAAALPTNQPPHDDRWPDLQARWFDAEYQVARFCEEATISSYLGETFPIFYPNLGPNVFAAMLKGALTFGETTSWIRSSPFGEDDVAQLRLDRGNVYYRKILEITRCALEVGRDKFWVGYTDMHPGLDCVDALMGTETTLTSMVDAPEQVVALVDRCTDLFLEEMEDFLALLQAAGQPSTSWMKIPFAKPMHIPSCDIGAMISPAMYRKFALPCIRREVQRFPYNIFHLDGADAVRHLDVLLSIEEIQAIQWVQGAGRNSDVLLWTGLIRRIQAAGRSVVVNLKLQELEPFLERVHPQGIFLCIDAWEADVQQAVIRRLLKWK